MSLPLDMRERSKRYANEATAFGAAGVASLAGSARAAAIALANAADAIDQHNARLQAARERTA